MESIKPNTKQIILQPQEAFKLTNELVNIFCDSEDSTCYSISKLRKKYPLLIDFFELIRHPN